MPKPRNLLPSIPLPVPYGAHVVEEGVQFTIFSRHAERVWLMIFDAPDAEVPDEEYELTPVENRIGDIWHVHLQHVEAGQYYLYRMEGTCATSGDTFFDPNQWLIDPYALAVTGSPTWGSRYGLQAGERPKHGAKFPKGIILDDNYDWSGDHTLCIPLEDTVIYETHLRGFTAHPSARVEHPGTYEGFQEKIPYLQSLGVTAVELLPIQEFNEMEYYVENMNRRDLLNYWGYSTINFFSPNGRYGARNTRGEPVRAFKDLVKALHRAGIEIILDIVFNHTAEGSGEGPCYSFRGIDNSIYYMMEGNGEQYRNYSGCGNTVNCNHPIVRSFIMDCLRYWTSHMHIDGFRFDLASVLTRGPSGEVLPNPSIVEQIAEDPILRHTKVIAEAWDAAGLYQVGSFPHERWSEWNGKFRDDIRTFWRGDPHPLRAFAARITGSGDLYHKGNLTPLKSINFVTCHDGFTLRDTVSYNQKHNEENGEQNRDGENHNLSCNYGHEGPTQDKKINAIRLQQQKNFIATLFLSQGVPMLLGGDEFSRTQHGNNNAYCQDSVISWIDWSLLEKNKPLYEFTKQLIAFRKEHPCLRQIQFPSAEVSSDTAPFTWLGPDGQPPDWDNGRSIGFIIETGQNEPPGADTLFTIFNASDHPVTYFFPQKSHPPWELAFHTQTKRPSIDRNTGTIVLGEKAVAVFS